MDVFINIMSFLSFLFVMLFFAIVGSVVQKIAEEITYQRRDEGRFKKIKLWKWKK